MLKEAGLFIISAGFLVYFISPSEEEPKPKPPAAEVTKKANTAPAQEADDWGDDEQDEDFVFGEPLVYSEDSESEAEDEAQETLSAAPAVSPQPIQSASRRTYRKSPVFKKSPAPGELGSRENPIDMSPSYSRQ